MKVLWVVNTIFPDLANRLGQAAPVFGGWMYGAAAMLAKAPAIHLSVAAVHPGSSLIAERIGDINYHLLASDGDLPQQWRVIIDQQRPDVIHVHGTEYAHGLELLRVAPEIPSVISIQGLVSVCARYYLAGLSFFDIVRNITLRDVLRNDNLFQQQRKMVRRGLTEREYLFRANVILGRTEWDMAHVEAIRPGAPYIHCDEMLRDEFYCDKHWAYGQCRPHTAFVSQASYPIKGLHQLIKATVLARRQFPDIEIRVAGPDITATPSWHSRVRLGGYASYLRKLIADTKLQDSVKFLGFLTASQMRAEYLRCNVSVCPSAIENSANSIAEAQILGVPLIASQVGGIGTMTAAYKVGKTYRFTEPEMLAALLVEEFSNIRATYDVRASELAHARHDRVRILRDMIRIYKGLMIRRAQWNGH